MAGLFQDKKVKVKNGMATCKKCGKPLDKCVDIDAIKRRQFLRKYLEFMGD